MKDEQTWEKFVKSVKCCWPDLLPNNKDEQWINLFEIYKMGYSDSLEDISDIIKKENHEFLKK